MSNEWKQTQLGDICEIVLGQSPSSDTYNQDRLGLPFFQGKSEFHAKYAQAKIWCSAPQKTAKKDDILISVRAPVGESNIAPENCCIGRGLAALRADQENLLQEFLWHQIHFKKGDLQGISQGSTFDAISGKDLSELEVAIPPLPEQKKIAEILSGIDNVIRAEQRKKSKLSSLRSSTVFKFTQSGLTGSLLDDSSKSGISRDWRVCELGEIFESYSYGPRFSAKDYSTFGNARTIRGTDVSANGEILYPQVPLAKLDEKLVSSHSLSDGDVVMITTADCGLTSVFREQDIPFICSAYAVRFTPSKSINPDYFVLFMQSELALRQVDSFVRKGTVANLPGSDVMKIKLPLPPVEEQNQIVQIIHSIDRQTKSIDNQINFYQNLQKSLSRELLSGRKRVSI